MSAIKKERPSSRHRYTIPKYLERRKLELLRRKIITRKFGYLFYRRTVSVILPSEARKYYLKALLKKWFGIWCSHWYDNTRGWKQSLRAEIHYNLKIKQTHFKEWRKYWTEHKSFRIKLQVAIIHYEKHSNNFALKFCFHNWKIFIKNNRAKKERLEWAWNYFKSKHFPEALKPYLRRWIFLCKVEQKRKEKLRKIVGLYQIKIMRRCFKCILEYKQIRVTKKRKNNVAKMHYEKRCLFVYFAKWHQYLDNSHQNRTNLLLADASYTFRLKKLYFGRLLINATRARFLQWVSNAIERFILKKALKNWKAYTEQKLTQREKCALLRQAREQMLVGRAFCVLKEYTKYRKAKKEKLLEIFEELNRRKAYYLFHKWRSYSIYRKNKALKSLTALTCYKRHLLQTHIRFWRKFVNYKRHRHSIKTQATQYYKQHLMSSSFIKILQNVARRREFRQKIEAAKVLYRTNLIQEAVQVIAMAGIRQKELTFQENVEIFRNKLFLAQKYFQIWKNKTIWRRKLACSQILYENHDKEEFYCDSDLVSFRGAEWFPMCVFMPRVFK